MSQATVKRERVPRTSAPILDVQIEKLKSLFPEAVSEGKVDFDKLRATLGDEVHTGRERFSFTWAGKQDCISLLQTPSRATLVPCPEESVNFGETENIFIEGDYQPTSNPETNGRYHSAWLSMMYPRLFLARQLLREDGVIFISCDDHEMHHLRILLNEIFGEEDFLATFVWANEGNIDNQSRIKVNHQYVVAYAREDENFTHPPVIDPSIPKNSKLYNPDIDNTIVKNGPGNPVTPVVLPKGFPADFAQGEVGPKENFWPKMSNEVHVKDHVTQNEVTVSSGWSSREIFEKFIESGFQPVTDTKGQETTFYLSNTGAIKARKKRLESQSHVLTILRGLGTVQSASSKLQELGIDFDYPKPVELIRYLAQIGLREEGIVMDFFAGSCPLAEAVLDLNRADGGNRRFVVVQFPEPMQNSDFATIAELGKERIRRVIRKNNENEQGTLNSEFEEKEDLGFKVFKLAASNYQPWTGVADRNPDAYVKAMELYTDPLVAGWQAIDVIWEVAIKEGYGLNARIETLAGAAGCENTVYRVTDPDKEQSFRICLDEELDVDIARALELSADDLFVCRDKALDDTAAANLALQCRLKTI